MADTTSVTIKLSVRRTNMVLETLREAKAQRERVGRDGDGEVVSPRAKVEARAFASELGQIIESIEGV